MDGLSSPAVGCSSQAGKAFAEMTLLCDTTHDTMAEGQRRRRVLCGLILPGFYSVGVLLLPDSGVGFCLSDWCVTAKVAGSLSVMGSGILFSSLFHSLSPARARTKTK